MFSSSSRLKIFLGVLGLASASFFSTVAVMADMTPPMTNETSESSDMMETEAKEPMSPSMSGETSESPDMMGTEAKKQTIVDIASSADSFKTLTAALKAADLVDVLAGEGPFTVFAPTDEAFAALPKGALEALLKPENKEKLVKILTYHVVSGNFMSTDLKSSEVATVEGSKVNIAVGEDKSVTVNDAKVLTADIKADNGVIHVIDKVILPPDI